MNLARALLGIAVVIILIMSIAVLATTINASVKGVAAGETKVEVHKVKIVGVEDQMRVVGWRLTVTAVDVVLVSDRTGTYRVVLTVSGLNTASSTTTITFSGTRTVRFSVTVTGEIFRNFYHRVEVSPA